ncbi:MAG TPA: ATP-binding protein [Egibacteraceae bacterium]|nr:ATP-binding protein [Egibacteraceae bacterium]
MEADTRDLARTAGLRELTVPRLEDVNRRRSQLWLLSLVVGLAVPTLILAIGYEVLSDRLSELLDLRSVRLGLLALLVAVFGYVAEREIALRRLTTLLVEERVLTASLVARVTELDSLLEASRAMNSSLDLHAVLDVILRSAYELLDAVDGSIQLVCSDDPLMMEVVAIRGVSTARLGQRQSIHQGLSGGAVQNRDALLVSGRHSASPRASHEGTALIVPLQIRDELVGVLNLAAGVAREPFTEYDLRSVAVFAETAAAAINNARNYLATQETVRSLTELDRLKDEFLAMVSHELRTPLTSLIGLAATIGKGAERFSTEQISELAEMARLQGVRLDRLVDDLLHTSRARHGALSIHPREIEVSVSVAEAISALRQTVGNRTLTLVTPDEPLSWVADPDAVVRIVTNLVGNAVKYTPAETTITVTLAGEADGVVLTVDDEGPGIPEEDRESIFEKFGRGTHTSGAGGLGLGLYIVRALAEAHGGSVRLDDSPGGGCRFRVTFPPLAAERFRELTVSASDRASA